MVDRAFDETNPSRRRSSGSNLPPLPPRRTRRSISDDDSADTAERLVAAETAHTLSPEPRPISSSHKITSTTGPVTIHELPPEVLEQRRRTHDPEPPERAHESASYVQVQKPDSPTAEAATALNRPVVPGSDHGEVPTISDEQPISRAELRRALRQQESIAVPAEAISRTASPARRESYIPWPNVETPDETVPRSLRKITSGEMYLDDDDDGNEGDSSARSKVRRRSTPGDARPRRRKRLMLVSIIIVLVVGAGAFAFSRIPQSDAPTAAADYSGPAGVPVDVVMPTDIEAKSVGQALVDAGVVKSVDAFTAQYSKRSGDPQAGETYSLRKGISGAEAIALLSDSANIVRTQITVKAGSRASVVYEKIASVLNVDVSEVREAAKDWKAIGLPQKAGNKRNAVEGWLFPGTYSIRQSDTATDVLAAMVARTTASLQEKKVARAQWEAVLTKASIVEKEMTFPKYQSKVARVVENLLARKEPLAMDSTIEYATGRPLTEISSKELNDKSNAYASRVVVGLPPTPIGNPDPKVVDAVVNPPKGDWLYFFTVNYDTGETKFATSFEGYRQIREEGNAWIEKNRKSTS